MHGNAGNRESSALWSYVNFSQNRLIVSLPCAVLCIIAFTSLSVLRENVTKDVSEEAY